MAELHPFPGVEGTPKLKKRSPVFLALLLLSMGVGTVLFLTFVSYTSGLLAGLVVRGFFVTAPF